MSGERTTDGDAAARILVVGDDPESAALAATRLERLIEAVAVEFVTETAVDRAIERIRTEPIDCLVSDHDAPGHEELELLEAIQEVETHLPVVFSGEEEYEVLAARVDTALQHRRLEERATDRSASADGRDRAEDRYEAILSALEDPVYVVDESGAVADVNDALLELTGRDGAALEGDSPSVFVEGRTPEASAEKAIDDPVGEPIDDPMRPDAEPSAGDLVAVRTADDERVICERRVGAVDGNDGRVCILRDVGERTAAESELQETNEKITAIHEFASEVTDCETVTDVLERTVDAAEHILEFDRCNADRRDGDELVPVARSSNVTRDEVRTFKVGEGITGKTVERQETIVLDDVRSNSDAEPVSTTVRSGISVPIGEHGTFQATSREPHDFDDTDVEFAELMASHAREAIERIKTETRLREERDRLAALFENVPQPAARVVIEDGPELDKANEAYEEAFGLTAEEHTPERVREKLVPEEGEMIDPVEAVADSEPRRFEVRRRTTDGVRDFLVTVIPVEGVDRRMLYAVYADIQERKRMERTLRRLHEATREMVRAADPETVADVAATTASETLGFPASAVQLYDEERDALEPTALTDETAEIFDETRVCGPDDGRIWRAFADVEVVQVDDLDAVETAVSYGDLRSLLVVPLGNHGVMPIGARVPSFFDDSDEYLARVLAANVEVALDRAERTRQLRDRDAELEREIDRLEKFASVVSHDLRNPLSIAAGHLELAAERCESDSARDHFERVDDAHERMEQLIDDLLALAREGETVDETEAVPLDRCARRAWRTVETKEASLELPREAPTIEADPERLRTLLENLFRNAVEHAGETVTVDVEALSSGGFAVGDDGPGLEVSPDSAFEYGTTSRTDGTGLGLAIVGEIAEAHGWGPAIEESDRGGARFVFRP